MIVIGTLAEFAGSFTSYAIGRRGGRPAVDRFGKYVLLTHRDLDRAERFFAGRGAWTVTVARVLPLVRAFAGLVSGLSRCRCAVRHLQPDRHGDLGRRR